MTLRTSLVITGDTEGAQASVRDLAKEMDGAGASAQRLSNAERQTEAATGQLTAEMRQAAQAAAGVAGANDNVSRTALQLLAAEQRLEAALAQVERAHRQAAAAADSDADAQLRVRQSVAAAEAGAASASAALLRLQQGQRGATEAGDAHFRSMGQQRQGAFMLGQNIQDMGVQLQMGTGIMQVLAMQAGQTATAIDQMGVKGAAGRVAAFFMTPWGAAVMAATMVLGPFIASLFESEDALEAVELASNALSDAQSVLGDIFDLQTGKIKNNTEALILNAQAKALNLRAQAAEKEASSTAAFRNAGAPTRLWTGVGAAAIASGMPDVGNWALQGSVGARNLGRLAREASAMTDEKARAARFREILKASEGADFEGSGTTKSEFQQAIVDAASARAERAIADQIDQSLNDGRLAEGLRRPDGKKPPKPKSTAGRDEFGRDAADTIAGIVGRYSESAKPFQQAAAEIRKLDDLIDDLARKRPPNFQDLIASAEDAKITVQQGLIRTVAEAFEKPATLGEKAGKAIGDLDAMMADLEKRRPPGFEALIQGARAAKGTIEGSLLRPYDEYIQAQEEQLKIQQLVNAGRLEEAEALRVINALKKQDVPIDAQKIENIKQINAELRAQQRETEKLQASQQKYLNALGDTRSIITGVIADPRSIVQAPEALLGTFRQLSAEYLFEKMFGNVFEQLQDEITGNGAIQRSAAKTSSSLDKVASAANAAANALRGVADPNAITVTGKRDSGGEYTPRSLFERIATGFAKGIGLDEKSADKLGKIVGKGFEGAFEGQMASGVASMLGIKQSSGGAAIGGAIGSFLPIPGGSIIGGLLGGTIGGLFRTNPSGTATLTSATGAASVGGTSAEMRKVAGGLAEQVQGGLKHVADLLGGTLGAFDLMIGTYDGKYRVRTTASGWNGKGGMNFKGDSARNLHDFGDDAAGAVAFAIADAVRDGAISGLSAAVQKAIRSNPDIDAALQEALKVADLELILGGVDAEMIRAFKSFEAQAKDRLRIATEYGFDVVEVEKLNAKERLELTNRLMEQQVGSLQRLVDEMTSGSMFEGTKVEQRDKLLTEIAQAQADLDAGVAGSADRLAQLLEQLNAVSREVYGTTGGFAADREAILDQARAAIAQANADIVAAQTQASDPALAQTNAALDENNDQNARIISALEEANRINAQMLARFGLVGGDQFALRQLAATS